MNKFIYQSLIGFYLLGFTLAWSQEKPVTPAAAVTVAAASDLKFALTEIVLTVIEICATLTGICIQI